MKRITADATDLMRQASMTAESYMNKAVDCIDQTFGDGYAKQHPDLVAAFMKVSSEDFSIGVLGAVIQDASDQIAGTLQEVAEMIGRISE
jgi:hypothetical protein